MFKKVLIADDLGSVNQGILIVLDTLGVKDVQQVQYCDDAYLKIKKAILDKSPFDLLITDLSFKADHRVENLKSGEDLVAVLQAEHPDLSIIIYSVEDRLQRIKSLVEWANVNSYVCKGRRGLIELSEAIQAVCNNKNYYSSQIQQVLQQRANLEIKDYDVELLKQLSKGLSQEEISHYFKTNNINPSSLSSIEKRLNRLKDQFNANNATHLVAMVKDIGLI